MQIPGLVKEKGGMMPQLPNDTRWTSHEACVQNFIANFCKYIEIINEQNVTKLFPLFPRMFDDRVVHLLEQFKMVSASLNKTMSPISLTEEQRQRMDANRQRALAIRRAKLAEAAAVTTIRTAVHPPKSNASTASINISSRILSNDIKGICSSTSSSIKTTINCNQKEQLSNVTQPLASNFSILNASTTCSINRITSSSVQESNQNLTTLLKTNSKAGNSYSNFTGVSNTGKSSTSFYSSNKNCSANSSSSKEATHSKCTVQPIFTGKVLNGTFSLISQERFFVDVGYHQALIEVFKTLPSKNYDAETKQWNFSINDHNELVEKIKPMRPAVCIAAIPAYVLKVLREATCLPPLHSVQLSSLDSRLSEALLPFQRDGVRFAVRRGGRVLIADDMGLGKTIQALGVASYYRGEWPLLVVTPSSVRYSWQEALRRWLGVQRCSVINTCQDTITEHEAVITSYDLLTRRRKEFERAHFNVVIMDESHMLKNFKSARYGAAAPVMKQAQRVVLLSGTPALSRPCELYTQITAVQPDMFPKFHDYGVRYCAGRSTMWGWDMTGSSNLQELQVLLQATIMIRRLKSEVLEQLPSKRREMVILDPASVKSSSSKELKESAAQLSLSSLKGSDRHFALLQFFAYTATAKLKAVSEYLKEQVEAGHKFLVFAHHRVMLDSLCETCEQQKVMYIRIEGSTPGDTRQALVDEFQRRDDVRVAVLSITAASTGITLTAASLVIFAELYWNPGILVQAEDRVHRLGQRDSVSVQYLVAHGTADDHIWPMVQHKLAVLSQAGLSKDDFSDSSATYQKACETNSITQYLVNLNHEELAEMEKDFEDVEECQDHANLPRKKPRLD